MKLLHALFGMLIGLTFAGSAVRAEDERATEPLVLTPENAFILVGPGWSGDQLQYLLLRYYVGEAAAEPYREGAKIDRAASPLFPVLRDQGPRTGLPAGKFCIALGPTRFLGEADRRRLAAQPGSILLKRQADAVLVAGDPAEAVCEFLNRVAQIRSYAPDEIWTSRPRDKQMVVDQLDYFRRRYFETSWFAPHWPRNKDWVRMNPTAGRLSVTCYHNLANIYPPEKYGATHPEIYELRGGERRVPTSIGTKIWNPCLSAKALPDLTMEYIRERMQTNPTTKYIPMGMMDINFDCECADCQASVKKYGGSYSNLYYELLNEVARRCQKEYPGLVITSFLYVNARTPPVDLKIEPNITVKVVTKTYRFVEPEWLEQEQRRIQTFSDLGAQWMIHDWCFSGVSPRSYMRQYGSFLQWGAQHGMVGAYIEYSPGENWYLDGAKYWVLTRLLADPYQDVDLLWKTYCNDMFGPASESMYRFYSHFQDKAVYAPNLIELADLPRQEPAMFTAEDLAYQRGWLEKALAEAKDDPLVQERLSKVMRYFRAHELFAEATATPHRLHVGFRGEGINQPLLAFYVRDDGRKLDEAIRYYDTQRSLPPDDNYMDVRLGLRVSYVNNYTRGFAALLQKIRGEAFRALPSNDVTQEGVARVVAKSRELLQQNLPADARPDRVQLMEAILGKVLWIPQVAAAPKIDGDLSDAAWEQGAVLGDFTESDTLFKPIHATEGRILRSGDKLYLGLTCRQTGEIWAQSPKETTAGTHIWRESGVEVFFGPRGEGETALPYAQYDINAFGAFRGFGTAKDNREGVEVEVRIDREAGLYRIEAALPLKAANYDYSQEKSLTFNVCRMVYTRDSYAADALLGWYPMFITMSNPASRSFVFFK